MWQVLHASEPDEYEAMWTFRSADNTEQGPFTTAELCNMLVR